MKYTQANKVQALEILLADPDLDEEDAFALNQPVKPVFSQLSTLFVKYYGLKLFSHTDWINRSLGENLEFVNLDTVKGFKVLDEKLFGNEDEINKTVADRHFKGEINHIKVGKKVWMTENLNVDRLQDGTKLFHAKTEDQWKYSLENEIPAYCFPSNNIMNGPDMGKLYNMYAVKDSRGLLPAGWKMPTDTDWTGLIKSFGGKQKATVNMIHKFLFYCTGYRDPISLSRNKDPLFHFLGFEAKGKLEYLTDRIEPKNQENTLGIMAGNSPIKSLSVIAGFWGGEFAKDDSWLWARLVDGEYIERDIKFNYGLSVRGIKSN